MQQLSRIIVRNSFFGVAAHIAIKILSFGFYVLTVRLLGADQMGEFIAAVAFGRVFIFIADLGIGPYTVREVARLRATIEGSARINDLFGAVLRLRFLLSLVATVLVIAVAWITDRPLLMLGAIALNMLVLILSNLQGATESMLAGFERLGLASAAKVYNQLLYMAVGAVALWLGFGYYGLIGATMAGVSLMLVVCWRALRRLDVHPGTGASWPWASVLRASLPFGVISFALGLSYNLDTVLLNIFRGNQETGFYTTAYGLVFSVLFLSNAVNTALYPSLSRASVSGSETLPAVYERCLGYLMIIAIPIALGGVTLAEPLVRFLYGEAFQSIAPVVQIVIWVVPLMFASEFLGYVVVISNQERYVARSIVVSTTLNVIFNLLLIPWLGLYGAAIMTVLTELVLVSQYLWLLRKTLASFNWQQVLFRPFLAALAMAWVVYLFRELPVLATIMIGALVYAVLLFLLGVVGKEEFRFMLSLRPGSAKPTTTQN